MKTFNELRPTSFDLSNQMFPMFIKSGAVENVVIKRLVDSTTVADRAIFYPHFVEECFERYAIGEDPHHNMCLFTVELSEQFFEFCCWGLHKTSKVVVTVCVVLLVFCAVLFKCFFPQILCFSFCKRDCGSGAPFGG